MAIRITTMVLTMLCASAAARAVNLPEGFRSTVAFANLTEPTAVRFAADGRVFVAEKSGIVKVFDNLDDATATTFADLRRNVYNFWDRGLLGLAVHPDFLRMPYVYVLYTLDAEIGGTPPRWGSGATSDDCPDPPGATGQGCVAAGRLSRLRVAANGTAAEEEVLIENWCQQFPGHSVGGLAFDAAGHLYVSAGESANWSFIDYGQRGAPPNPCGDPPVGVGGEQTPPTASGGALRAQSLAPGASGAVTYDGKILRVDDAGRAAAGNPLSDGNGMGASRIVARGLRQPFRIAARPGTSELWIGEVGWENWEEINRVADPAGAVENFGWPCFEGPDPQPAWASAGLHACDALYDDPGSVSEPFFTYAHSERVVATDSCEPGTSSVSGLAFYDGTSFPAEYHGALFFADLSRSCIWVMPTGANGVPDPSRRRTFASEVTGVVDLVVGPGGDLFYADVIDGAIRRIGSTHSNSPPVARAGADRVSGPVPLTVNFDGSASSDGDGPPPLRYDWDLNGDGTFGDSSSARPSFTFATPGRYTVTLRVSDGAQASTTTTITIDAGANRPPVAHIDTPNGSAAWHVGETIAFSGRGEDPEDGTLPADDLTWELILHHCPDNCHAHSLQSFEGVTGGELSAPDHEFPSHLELRLTVTDSHGQSHTQSVLLHPDTVPLTFASDPVGLQLTANSVTANAPFSLDVIVGSENGVGVPSPQDRECVSYRFVSWSDAGSRSHTISAPSEPTTLTAVFDTVDTCRAPVAVIEATPRSGAVPLTVSFDASKSFDPDAETDLSFDWDLDGDGSFDDSEAVAPTHTYLVPRRFAVALRVTDGDGDSGTQSVAISALAPCSGDCDVDGSVTVSEIVRIVTIALGAAAPASCANGDADADGVMTVLDIVVSVASSLQECTSPPSSGGGPRQ